MRRFALSAVAFVLLLMAGMACGQQPKASNEWRPPVSIWAGSSSEGIIQAYQKATPPQYQINRLRPVSAPRAPIPQRQPVKLPQPAPRRDAGSQPAARATGLQPVSYSAGAVEEAVEEARRLAAQEIIQVKMTEPNP